MMKTSIGVCHYCGDWVEGEERCDCPGAGGCHWGGGSEDEASPGQENAIRYLEEALSLVDDDWRSVA